MSNSNANKLWALIVPSITCDFCGKREEGPGSDDHDFAEHLDKSGWVVKTARERVKCPTCNKKRK